MDKSPLATTDAEIAPVLDENNVYFASGSTVVDQAGKEKLRRHAEDLKQNQKKILTLAGHTDDTGSRNYNLAIAEERLMNVSRLLLAYGAPARQIRRNRIGNIKKPPACKTAECREKMRRVELIYLP
jgi:outer membrane protein OmpA-like peptidoglycan-associated protein